MSQFNRRKFLKKTSAAAGIAAAPMLWPASAQAQWSNQPEKGAKLRVLRWKRFVQGDEDMWLANTKKFTQLTGVEVRVDNEGWEDVRPKAAVAANVGSGPDIIIGWFDDPQQYPDKLNDISDIANLLGKKHGGWYDVCKRYGMPRLVSWMLLLGLLLGFGAMTWPHLMARAMLAEQLWRATSILAGHPYHRSG